MVLVPATIAGNGDVSGGLMYPGGKGHCFREIINLMPPHQVYIEPYLGGGAVMRNKRPALINIGLELAPDVLEQTARQVRPDGTYCIVKSGDAAASLQMASKARAVIAASGQCLAVR